MQLRDKAAQLMRVQLIERRIAGVPCKLNQRFNVAEISRCGVRGQSPLVGEVRKIMRQVFLGRHTVTLQIAHCRCRYDVRQA